MVAEADDRRLCFPLRTLPSRRPVNGILGARGGLSLSVDSNPFAGRALGVVAARFGMTIRSDSTASIPFLF